MKEILNEIIGIIVAVIIIMIPFYYAKYDSVIYHIVFYIDVIAVTRLVLFYLRHKNNGGEEDGDSN